MAETEMQKKHNGYMIGVIILAVVHALLSGAVAYLFSEGKFPSQYMVPFLIISVVVNILILILSALCKNLSM